MALSLQSLRLVQWWMQITTPLLVACTGAFGMTDGDPLGNPSTDPPADSNGASVGSSGTPLVIGQEFDCEPRSAQDPGPYLIRRLTAREYANTVRVALGVDVSDLLSQWPVDPAESLSQAAAVSYEHVVAYADLASAIVDRLPDLSAFTGCTTLTFLCEEQFVESLGAALLRRPMPANERDPLFELFRAAEAAGASFDEGARLVLESMLQSPRFLYRIDSQAGVGPTRDLDPYEVASKLSYFLWDGPPDENLMETAATGELATDAGLSGQVERMLSDPRAIETSLRFVDEWMRLDQTADLPLGAAMREETEALFQHVVWTEDQSLTALFKAPYTFASAELARSYGLEGVGTGLSRYEFGSDSPRRGILTHGSTLSSGGMLGSPVLRGLFILENVLCGAVGPPPPGVTLTRSEPEPGRSVRYYSEQRVQDPVCGGCHRQFEPLSYGIEPFAADGSFRTIDEHGNPFRSDGVFVTPYDEEGVPFANTVELAELVAADPRVRDCATMRVTQFVLGRPLDASDACTLNEVRGELESGSPRYVDLVRAILTQPAFRQIRTN